MPRTQTHTVGTGRVCRHKAIVNSSQRAAHSLRTRALDGKDKIGRFLPGPHTDVNRRGLRGRALFSWAGTCFRQAPHARRVPPRQRVSAGPACEAVTSR